jgi:hypothetical protein
VPVSNALARVAEIEALVARTIPAQAPPVTAPAQGGFAAALSAAGAAGSAVPIPAGSAGAGTLAVATGELGIREEPPGSNEGARIADYRAAVAGSYPGSPWCAYFVSWAAAQAGSPIGDGGVGLGSVDGIAAWAGRTSRLLPADATPAPGDLILFGSAHVGIVESVNPDGSLTTVEGNHANAVERVTRSRSEATGYVRL